MTLHRREDGEISFECNSCEDALETLTRDFQSALIELREQGWKTIRRDEWEHECPDCQGDTGSANDFEDVS